MWEWKNILLNAFALMITVWVKSMLLAVWVAKFKCSLAKCMFFRAASNRWWWMILLWKVCAQENKSPVQAAERRSKWMEGHKECIRLKERLHGEKPWNSWAGQEPSRRAEAVLGGWEGSDAKGVGAPVEKGRKPAWDIVLMECCRKAVTALGRDRGGLSGGKARAVGASVAAEEQHWGEGQSRGNALSYKATCRSGAVAARGQGWEGWRGTGQQRGAVSSGAAAWRRWWEGSSRWYIMWKVILAKWMQLLLSKRICSSSHPSHCRKSI